MRISSSMSVASGRLFYSDVMLVETGLSAAVIEDRIRAMATARPTVVTPEQRRRQILGWNFTERDEEFSLQPRYGDSLSLYGPRFVGRVESRGSGSSVIGRVVLSRLTMVIMSGWMTVVAVAGIVGLAEGQEPALKVIGIVGAMLAAAALMVRYSVRSTANAIEACLRVALAAASPLK